MSHGLTTYHVHVVIPSQVYVCLPLADITSQKVHDGLICKNIASKRCPFHVVLVQHAALVPHVHIDVLLNAFDFLRLHYSCC